MPNLIRPVLPGEVEIAIGVIGSRAQTQILRHLAILGPSAIGRLQAAMDISRPSLNRHLEALSKAGLVQTDPPAGMRQGRDVVYAVQLARLRGLAREYISYVEGN
ncbi:ArsR/SmtB family transcription factor [Arthrobacter sulfonylureivorans]|uniref:MarR family transcriptional regulator n=1 Tax=Arthrobacter sulfonylureivorans TaxID=2486855 RepID=A0ABY3WF87_9MICC|nr:helix-turn-helix domain-containing protein [Arthrobacter sulfonylureivorans]UNK47853.1 MarR family transcriptional regulator [Arthrobacter sulfonylureivorans]